MFSKVCSRALRYAAVTMLCAVSMSTGAHHSTAVYDSNKSVTLTGTVTEIHWVNPHTYFTINVAEKAGKHTSWNILSGTPTLNVRNGWKYDDMKKGDKVTIVGLPDRSGKPAAILLRITLADGRTIAGPREFLKVPDAAQ